MQETMSPFDQAATILRPDAETPFKDNNVLQVTPEELAGIRAFIRHLKPGVYIKCARCEKMKYNANIYFTGGDDVHCQGCA